MAKDLGRRYTLRLNPLDEKHAIILDYFAKMERDKPTQSKNKFLVECVLQRIAEEEALKSDDPNRKASYRDLARLKAQLEIMIKDEIIKTLSNGFTVPVRTEVAIENEKQSDGEISDAALKAIASWD